MKSIHRISFIIGLVSIVLFIFFAIIIEASKFTKYLDSHSFLWIPLYLASIFNIYAVGFCIYDLFKCHRHVFLKLLWISLFFIIPLLSTWIYFEIYLFQSFYFNKSS